jgi:hypothetical protein
VRGESPGAEPDGYHMVSGSACHELEVLSLMQ